MTRATAGFRGRETAPPEATIQAVQRQARAKYLVGRERELRRFADLLAAGNAPRILFLHGPGGIGKSSLLEGFRNTARQLDRKFNYLDARLLPARPDAVSRAIDQVLAEPHAGEGPRVLALDHTEQLAALDGWLRTELLPGLPAGIVLVVAGRHRPGPQWHADPGLGELLIDIELVPLEPNAVSEYLQRRNVPDKHSAAVPCAQALFRHLQRHAPLRGGEQVMLARFLLAHDTHQARTPVWAEMVSQLNGLMFTPGITLLGYVSDLAFDWEGIAEHANAWILPDSKYQLAGRDYGITAHDLRREPPLEWARNCVERILRNGEAPELQPSEVVLLEETAFADAVVEALHAFRDDAALARSPLLHSPVLRRCRSRRDPDALRGLIQETSAAQLSAPRRPCTLHDVLEQVYFVPVGKHRSAAEVLHVSERTLRRRLREAESRLIDALWKLETGGIHHGTPVARE